MTIDEMMQRKKELGLTNAMISEKTGIALGTVQKIFSGVTASPRYDTVQKLEKLLAASRGKVYGNNETGQQYRQADSDHSYVKEVARDYNAAIKEKTHSAASDHERYKPIVITRQITLDESCDEKWTRQGEYTLKEYYALPDDVRVELIDGVFYNLAAPSLVHQTIAFETGVKLRECIKDNNMPCKVYLAPVDVRLDKDDKTMVEPDVVVICHENDDDKRIEGAPELVIEILSETTRRKDCTIKLEKYLNAGVKEYWIIDPDNEAVWVYDFANDDYPKYYSFESTVPVSISEGKCEIDFAEVKRNL